MLIYMPVGTNNRGGNVFLSKNHANTIVPSIKRFTFFAENETRMA